MDFYVHLIIYFKRAVYATVFSNILQKFLQIIYAPDAAALVFSGFMV
jgi:hypothetical protein